MKKILCLHGYAMNDVWFKEWLSPIEQALAGRAELIYPRAPIACPPEEVRAMMQRFNAFMPESRFGNGQNWCWFRATDDKPPHYAGLETTLTWLAQLCRDAQIDGVIGWSQGGVLAAIMAAKKFQSGQFDFDWVVLCGAFLPGDPVCKALFETPLPMPSLHVVGTKESDFMRQRAKYLFDACKDGEWLDTPAGHVMPVKHPDCMDRITAWIEMRLS